MQKKKFDLTSNIVEVKLEEQMPASLSFIENTQKVIVKNNILLTLSIDVKKRNEFKAWCAKKGIKMNEAFLKAFELLKKHSDI